MEDRSTLGASVVRLARREAFTSNPVSARTRPISWSTNPVLGQIDLCVE